MKTIRQLLNFVEANELHLWPPGSAQWQEPGCYTAYKNFKNPNGCVMAEHKNPVKALLMLYEQLTRKKPDGQEKGS